MVELELSEEPGDKRNKIKESHQFKFLELCNLFNIDHQKPTFECLWLKFQMENYERSEIKAMSKKNIEIKVEKS